MNPLLLLAATQLLFEGNFFYEKIHECYEYPSEEDESWIKNDVMGRSPLPMLYYGFCYSTKSNPKKVIDYTVLKRLK